MDREDFRDIGEAAISAEYDAYRMMRTLIPDLDLPARLRAPLSRRQQLAVADYQFARDRLRIGRTFEGQQAILARTA